MAIATCPAACVAASTVPSGAGVTDDDPSHYLGVTADLIVEKPRW